MQGAQPRAAECSAGRRKGCGLRGPPRVLPLASARGIPRRRPSAGWATPGPSQRSRAQAHACILVAPNSDGRQQQRAVRPGQAGLALLPGTMGATRGLSSSAGIAGPGHGTAELGQLIDLAAAVAFIAARLPGRRTDPQWPLRGHSHRPRSSRMWSTLLLSIVPV
jgi:hypothetical protein